MEFSRFSYMRSPRKKRCLQLLWDILGRFLVEPQPEKDGIMKHITARNACSGGEGLSLQGKHKPTSTAVFLISSLGLFHRRLGLMQGEPIQDRCESDAVRASTARSLLWSARDRST